MVIVNWFGTIPEANKPNKWRLIVDLSFPHGSSVNDSILAADVSMIYIRTYASIEDAGQIISKLGEKSLLAKLAFPAPSA